MDRRVRLNGPFVFVAGTDLYDEDRTDFLRGESRIAGEATFHATLPPAPHGHDVEVL